eukprot:1139386-Pelagomonas_calceolata.AAC.1
MPSFPADKKKERKIFTCRSAVCIGTSSLLSPSSRLTRQDKEKKRKDYESHAQLHALRKGPLTSRQEFLLVPRVLTVLRLVLRCSKVPRSALFVKSMPHFDSKVLSTTSLFYIFTSPAGCPV